jgi:hypothetical protein
VAGHIFQARPVWIYTQSNITNIICIYFSSRNTVVVNKQCLQAFINFIH